MASFGHVAVGVAAARLFASAPGAWWRQPRSRAPAFSWRTAVAGAALSLLPDADAIAFTLHIPYGAAFGHRGATHSFAFALVAGVLAALAAPRAWGKARTGVYVAVLVATHGLLDAMTDGGLGVALLWPLTTKRYFLPWRPIPVAPIGIGLASWRGATVLLTEIVAFAPLWLWALWPRGKERPDTQR